MPAQRSSRSKAVVEGNRDHLRAWMPWANESTALPAIELRIDKFDRAFRSESEWLYAVFSSGKSHLLGGVGLQRSMEKGAVEIGFWLGQSWTKQGYATEAVKSLAEHAMSFPHVERVEIRCDARNAASAAVARRAGFTQGPTLKNHVFEKGAAPRDTVVWQLSRAGASQATAAPVGLWSRIKRLLTAATPQ